MQVLENYPRKKIIQLDIQSEIDHGICVSNLAFRISKDLGLSHETCKQLSVAGIVHDIGKMRLVRYIYGDNKDNLTVEELKYIRLHPALGAEILKEQGYSDFIVESIYYHHENYDGTGYPENLKAEEIPMGSRILRVCDVFAALTSQRPYREAFDVETTIELMIEEVKNFDMKVFLALQRTVHTEDIRDILGMSYKQKNEKDRKIGSGL
ncbi:MAG TPA: HD domain-containing protein [Candidatus Merdenecus merdavium]|nr:HD domain-containing protein [Candidatus Merdenecus merdavium]